jgi:hypothetical protein
MFDLGVRELESGVSVGGAVPWEEAFAMQDIPDSDTLLGAEAKGRRGDWRVILPLGLMVGFDFGLEDICFTETRRAVCGSIVKL